MMETKNEFWFCLMKRVRKMITALVTMGLPCLVPLLCCVPSAVGQTTQQQGTQQQAWDILQGGLSDENASRRTQAVRALGLLPGNQKALADAEAALEDKEPAVRAAAATALGEMRATSSIPKLRKALSDDDARVVLAAAHALRDLKDPVAYEVFYEMLTGERKPGESLKGQGMDTLRDRKKMAKIGFEEGIGFIPFADIGYSAVKAVTKDDVSPVRAAAANILASDPDPRTGKALVEAASDKKWMVRLAALEAIAKRGDPQLLSGIVPEMSDNNEAVRMTAAAAVFKLSAIAKATATAGTTTPQSKASKAPRRAKAQN